MTFSFICRFRNFNAKQKISLQRIANFSSKVICDQVRSLFLFCDHLVLHKVNFEGPRACLVWGVRTPAPWASLQIDNMQNQQTRQLFRPHSSSTPQQVVIGSFNQLFTRYFSPFYQLFTSYYQSIQFWSQFCNLVTALCCKSELSVLHECCPIIRFKWSDCVCVQLIK